MRRFYNLEHYKNEQEKDLPVGGYPEIEKYIASLYHSMNIYIKTITEENFWEVLPNILGIDSKLMLLTELVPTIEDPLVAFTEKEVIEWVEKDFISYNAEMCGFKLNQRTNSSVIYNVK